MFVVYLQNKKSRSVMNGPFFELVIFLFLTRSNFLFQCIKHNWRSNKHR